MKRRVSVHMENWAAKIPFRISRHTAYDFPCVVCEIGENGVIGRGEALGVYYLGDTEQSMLEQLTSIEDALAGGAEIIRQGCLFSNGRKVRVSFVMCEGRAPNNHQDPRPRFRLPRDRAPSFISRFAALKDRRSAQI